MTGPIVVFPSDGMTVPEALEATGLSERTLYRWNSAHRIARRLADGRLLFSFPALMMLQHRDIEALELLRAGDRLNARVLQYIDLCGVMREPSG